MVPFHLLQMSRDSLSAVHPRLPPLGRGLGAGEGGTKQGGARNLRPKLWHC